MTRSKSLLAASLAAALALACSSDDQDDEVSEGYACTPGLSVACVGVGNCQGYQICKSDGTGYDACQCSGNPAGSTGGTNSTSTSTLPTRGGSFGTSSGGSTGVGSGGTAQTSVGAASSVGSAGFATTSNGGVTSAGATSSFGGSAGLGATSSLGGVTSAGATSSLGGVTSAGGTSSLGGSSGAGVCAPADMTGHTYPAYVPARRLFGTCTESDAQSYFTNCYQKGSCADFQTGGAKAACGACLKPSAQNETAYGPLIRFGTGASALDQTNMAGCIELVGEADCAKKMMVETLCEYDSCATNCSGSYQALANCMVDSRNTSCAAAQKAAVCIADSAHVAACSGSGFEGQFMALARVFCVQSH